jgi:hypothetical protein
LISLFLEDIGRPILSGVEGSFACMVHVIVFAYF